jgi:hypothetical protein
LGSFCPRRVGDLTLINDERIEMHKKCVNILLSGSILSVETIRLDHEDGVVNTESTIWKEDSSDSKKFIFAVRVFIVVQQTVAIETVGEIMRIFSIFPVTKQ